MPPRRGRRERHVPRSRTRDFARRLHHEPTDAEQHLWHFLRARKLGVKFRRQAAVGAYIVDFVCFSHCLIIELDGPQHLTEEGRTHDAQRTAWLAARGFRLLRYRNQVLDEEIQRVLEEIRQALASQGERAGEREGEV